MKGPSERKPTKLARLKARSKDAWRRYLIAQGNLKRSQHWNAKAYDRYFKAEGKVNAERVRIANERANRTRRATPEAKYP